MEKQKNFWDKNAGRYDCFMRKDAAAYEQMYELLRPVVRHKTVLELATGTGLIAKNIVNSAAHIEATDASPEMIAEAKRDNRSAKLHFSVQDMFHLPYADKSFDVVIVANALHIVPEPEKALSEIRRVLKDDGVLVAPTFTHEIEVIHIPHRNVILRGRRSVNITRHERQHDVSEPVTGKYGVILRIADMFLRDGLSRLDQPAEEMSVVFLGYFNHRLFGFDVADKNTTRAARGCTDCRRDRCGRNDDSFHGFHTTPPLLQTPCRQPPSCSTPLPADKIWSGSGYRFPP